jgi:hypothetical protein
MSLKNIEAVLHWASRGDAPEELAAAIDEVEALRKVCRIATDPAEAGNDAAHDEAFRLFAAIAKESIT